MAFYSRKNCFIRLLVYFLMGGQVSYSAGISTMAFPDHERYSPPFVRFGEQAVVSRIAFAFTAPDRRPLSAALYRGVAAFWATPVSETLSVAPPEKLAEMNAAAAVSSEQFLWDLIRASSRKKGLQQSQAQDQDQEISERRFYQLRSGDCDLSTALNWLNLARQGNPVMMSAVTHSAETGRTEIFYAPVVFVTGIDRKRSLWDEMVFSQSIHKVSAAHALIIWTRLSARSTVARPVILVPVQTLESLDDTTAALILSHEIVKAGLWSSPQKPAPRQETIQRQGIALFNATVMGAHGPSIQTRDRQLWIPGQIPDEPVVSLIRDLSHPASIKALLQLAETNDDIFDRVIWAALISSFHADDQVSQPALNLLTKLHLLEQKRGNSIEQVGPRLLRWGAMTSGADAPEIKASFERLFGSTVALAPLAVRVERGRHLMGGIKGQAIIQKNLHALFHLLAVLQSASMEPLLRPTADDKYFLDHFLIRVNSDETAELNEYQRSNTLPVHLDRLLEIVRDYPYDGLPLSIIARAYAQLHQMELAEVYARKALYYSGGRAETAWSLIEFLIHQQRFDEARQILQTLPSSQANTSVICVAWSQLSRMRAHIEKGIDAKTRSVLLQEAVHFAQQAVQAAKSSKARLFAEKSVVLSQQDLFDFEETMHPDESRTTENGTLRGWLFSPLLSPTLQLTALMRKFPESYDQILALAKESDASRDHVVSACIVARSHTNPVILNAAEKILLQLGRPDGVQPDDFFHSRITAVASRVLSGAALSAGVQNPRHAQIFRQLFNGAPMATVEERLAAGRHTLAALQGIGLSAGQFFIARLATFLRGNLASSGWSITEDDENFLNEINRVVDGDLIIELNTLIKQREQLPLHEKMKILVQQFPYNATVLDLMAQTLQRLGKLAEAERYARDAVAFSDSKRPYATLLSALLYQQHQFDEAESLLRSILAVAPHNVRALVVYSSLLRERLLCDQQADASTRRKWSEKNIAYAIEACLFARKESEHHIAGENLDKTILLISDQAEVRSIGQRYIAVHPKLSAGYRFMAKAALHWGNIPEALNFADLALALELRPVRILRLVLKIFATGFETGAFSAEEPTQLRDQRNYDQEASAIYKNYRSYPSITLAYAEYLMARGRKEEGLQVAKRILSKAPESTAATKLRALFPETGAGAFWADPVPTTLGKEAHPVLEHIDATALGKLRTFFLRIIQDVLSDVPQENKDAEAQRRLTGLLRGDYTLPGALKILGLQPDGNRLLLTTLVRHEVSQHFEVVQAYVQFVFTEKGKTSVWNDLLRSASDDGVQAPNAVILWVKHPTPTPIIFVLREPFDALDARSRETLLQHEIVKAHLWTQQKLPAPRANTIIRQGVDRFNNAAAEVRESNQHLPAVPQGAASLLDYKILTSIRNWNVSFEIRAQFHAVILMAVDPLKTFVFGALAALSHGSEEIRDASEDLLLTSVFQDLESFDANPFDTLRTSDYLMQVLAMTLHAALLGEGVTPEIETVYRSMFSDEEEALPLPAKLQTYREMAAQLCRVWISSGFINDFRQWMSKFRKSLADEIGPLSNEDNVFLDSLLIEDEKTMSVDLKTQLASPQSQKSLEKLLAEIDQRLTQSPFDSNYLSLRAEILMRLHRQEEGLSAARLVARLADRRNKEALSAYGHILFSEGFVEKAEQLFIRAIQWNSTSVSALLGLAEIYSMRGEFEKALTMAKAAMRNAMHVVSPPELLNKIRIQRIQIHIRAGQTKEAWKLLEELAAHFSQNANVRWIMAGLAAQEHKVNVAWKFVREALAIDGDSPSSHEFFLEFLKVLITANPLSEESLLEVDRSARTAFDRFPRALTVQIRYADYLTTRLRLDEADSILRGILQLFSTHRLAQQAYERLRAAA